MRHLHKLLLAAFGAAFFMASAQAQNAGTVTNHALPIGKGPGVAGYGSLVIGNGQVPIGQTSADPQAKTLSGDITLDNAGVTAIGANKVTNAKLAQGAANTFKGSLNGSTTTDIALTACSLAYQVTKWVAGTGWQCGINPVLPSRATAATLDLSAHSIIRTLSYTTASDGGGATFYKLSGTQFLDQNIATGTISGNGTSGCTNGTYQVYGFTGGSGTGFMATVTVAGNVVTAITKMFNAGGFGYAVGDVLSTTITGCSTTVTYTVSTVTTPKASFTDSSGNKWQYLSTDFIDPRQFGAKFDWAGVDASATDDAASIQAALDYGSYLGAVNDFTTNGAPMAGTTVLMPRGMALVCSPLTVWGGTNVRGQGLFSTGLHMCDAWASGATNFLTMCDTAAHIACFGAQISDMVLSATTSAAANAGTYMIYTNAAQQARAISNVAVYGGKRGCLRYDTGYGGAAGFYVYDMLCTMFSASLSDGIVINGGTTLFKFFNTIVEGSYTGNGFNLLGGQITIDGFHTELITTGINVSLATSTHSATVMHATGGSSCTELVKLQNANTAGNFAIYDAVLNGCTRLVTDGQTSGTNRTTDARPKDGWVFFNP